MSSSLLAMWYEIGARAGANVTLYWMSAGGACRRAYLAGVMARAFGVDLSGAVQ